MNHSPAFAARGEEGGTCVRLGSSRLHYARFGNGRRVLLAFHGFGQHGRHFEVLAGALAAEYVTYSFDLFYHGRSEWADPDQVLTKADWAALMRAFFERENVNACSVVGFSLGARPALATAEAFPDRIEAVFLLAPDGITPNPWYTLATRSGWTQRLFRQAVFHPGVFRRLTRLAQTLRLVHPGWVRFAHRQLDTPEKRYQLYHTWLGFRRLRFDVPTLADLFNERGIRTEIFLGRHDRLLTESHVRPLLRRLKHGKLTLLPCGHGGLLAGVAAHWRTRGMGEIWP
ncbi:MAG: alpha/beta hydrolase [Ferruginibacter sp.]|nr:alpha/beta hydrolase [Cytophagales bacterium]